jgi:hypothetical protein
MEVFSFERIGRTVHLIDTPGFDDTVMTDSTLLEDIADWLSKAYTRGIRLNGIIYLHPIAHNRMQGSSLACLRIFQKICGTHISSAIILGSTMWDKVDSQTGQRRETELVETPEFWGEMVEAGSRTFRFQGNQRSGLIVCDHIIQQNQEITLALQHQMVNEHKALHETDAGQEIERTLLQVREICRQQLQEAYREAQQALHSHNQQAALEMSILVDTHLAQINASDKALEAIRTDMQNLHKRRERAIEEELNQLTQEQDCERILMAEKLLELEQLQRSLGSQEEEDLERRLAQETYHARRISETNDLPPLSEKVIAARIKYEDCKREVAVYQQRQIERTQKIDRYSSRVGVAAGVIGAGLQAAAIGVSVASCVTM